MLDTPRSEVVWRILATHSIRQFPLHFPSLRHRVPSGFKRTLQRESVHVLIQRFRNWTVPRASWIHVTFIRSISNVRFNVVLHLSVANNLSLSGCRKWNSLRFFHHIDEWQFIDLLSCWVLQKDCVLWGQKNAQNLTKWPNLHLGLQEAAAHLQFFTDLCLLIFKLYIFCTVKPAPQTETRILLGYMQLVQSHQQHLMTIPSFRYGVKWSFTQHEQRTIRVSEHADVWSLTRACSFSLSSKVCSMQNWNNYIALPASCTFWPASRLNTSTLLWDTAKTVTKCSLRM